MLEENKTEKYRLDRRSNVWDQQAKHSASYQIHKI